MTPEEEDHTRLARIDERVKFISFEITEIKIRLSKQFVTQDQFRPVKLLVYSMVGITLSAVLAGLIRVVIS